MHIGKHADDLKNIQKNCWIILILFFTLQKKNYLIGKFQAISFTMVICYLLPTDSLRIIYI